MRILKYWGPTIVLMAVIFFLSSRRRVQVSEVFEVQFLIMKSLHVIEYAILFVLSYRSLKNTSGEEAWKNRFNAFLIALGYAISDEVHQVFVPTREGHMRDIIIDAFGISLAYYYIWKLLPKAPKPLKNLAQKLDII